MVSPGVRSGRIRIQVVTCNWPDIRQGTAPTTLPAKSGFTLIRGQGEVTRLDGTVATAVQTEETTGCIFMKTMTPNTIMVAAVLGCGLITAGFAVEPEKAEKKVSWQVTGELEEA